MGDRIEEMVQRPTTTFEDLYFQEFERLVCLAHFLVGSTPVAQDIVQDSFAKLLRHWDGVNVPQAWLRRAVTNACRNERRRLGNVRRFLPQVAQESSVSEQPESELVASLQRLPYRQRAVVVLRFYVDLPEAEIAQLLGMRVGTVKSSLHRALHQLRNEVEQ